MLCNRLNRGLQPGRAFNINLLDVFMSLSSCLSPISRRSHSQAQSQQEWRQQGLLSLAQMSELLLPLGSWRCRHSGVFLICAAQEVLGHNGVIEDKKWGEVDRSEGRSAGGGAAGLLAPRPMAQPVQPRTMPASRGRKLSLVTFVGLLLAAKKLEPRQRQRKAVRVELCAHHGCATLPMTAYTRPMLATFMPLPWQVGHSSSKRVTVWDS